MLTRRKDYEEVVANRVYFGDFDLIFRAAKLNLKILEIHIRYRERTYACHQHLPLEAWTAVVEDGRLRSERD